MSRPPEDFEHDPRYRHSLRETWLCIAYWALFTAACMTIAWWLGSGVDGAEQTFIMGFPAWFFWSALAFIGLSSAIVPYLMVRFLFRDMSLEPHDDGLEGPSESHAVHGAAVDAADAADAVDAVDAGNAPSLPDSERSAR